jgi:DNA-binding CsgD family transcriptional regulator
MAQFFSDRAMNLHTTPSLRTGVLEPNASSTGVNGNRRQPPPTALIEQAHMVSGATDTGALVSTSLLLAAWRGQEARVLQLVEVSIQDANPTSERAAVYLADYASAVLYNGLSRYEPARLAAQRTCANEHLGFLLWALPELVEASARSGSLDTARAALCRIEQRTAAAPTDPTLGIEARSRALLNDGDEADALYRDACQHFSGGRVALQLARTHLLYGEFLRRNGRRTDARSQLRVAHEAFSSAGAAGFAERARRELLATGETVRRRTVEARDDLTAQEEQIAVLAGRGYTNGEVGAELFLSPRTIEWHLRKVFVKLGIRSRRELRDLRHGSNGNGGHNGSTLTSDSG